MTNKDEAIELNVKRQDAFKFIKSIMQEDIKDKAKTHTLKRWVKLAATIGY
jgi:hypothetical protein